MQMNKVFFVGLSKENAQIIVTFLKRKRHMLIAQSIDTMNLKPITTKATLAPD